MNWYSIFWFYWSYIGFLPMLLCCILRWREPEPKKIVKRGLVDEAFCLMMLPAIFYYALDSIYIICEPQHWNPCNMSYLVHHLITLSGVKHHLAIVTYPWFLMVPFTFHCLLLIFPEIQLLTYLYVVVIVYAIWRLTTAPWNTDSNLQFVKLNGIGLLGIALPMLWYFGCKNTMDNVS